MLLYICFVINNEQLYLWNLVVMEITLLKKKPWKSCSVLPTSYIFCDMYTCSTVFFLFVHLMRTCILTSAANWSKKFITINLSLRIFDHWLILILALAQISKIKWPLRTTLAYGSFKVSEKASLVSQFTYFIIQCSQKSSMDGWKMAFDEVRQHWF